MLVGEGRDLRGRGAGGCWEVWEGEAHVLEVLAGAVGDGRMRVVALERMVGGCCGKGLAVFAVDVVSERR